MLVCTHAVAVVVSAPSSPGKKRCSESRDTVVKLRLDPDHHIFSMRLSLYTGTRERRVALPHLSLMLNSGTGSLSLSAAE